MDDVLDNFESLSISESQSNSTGRVVPNLGNLATKLKVTILKSMSDLASLISLVQSSPEYYSVFISRRHEILSYVTGLLNMQPQVLVDALAVRDASVTIAFAYGISWKSGVKAHIQQYQSFLLLLPMASRYGDAKDLNHLHEILCHLTRHFASIVLSKHPVTGEQMAGTENISKEETRRLHRAFYRLELFSKFFVVGSNPLPLDGTDHYYIQGCTFGALDISKLYFGMLETYEVEEIGCLYNYMWEIYAEALRSLAVKLLPKDVSPGGKLFHANISYFMTLGLGFLHQVLHASSHQAKVILFRDNLHVPYPSIASALGQPSPHTLYSTDKFKEKDGSMLAFTNDDGTGPNAAWVWSTGGMYEFGYFRPEKATMRSWGYVFWDKKRLDGWGVLGVDPSEFVKVAMENEAFTKYVKCAQ